MVIFFLSEFVRLETQRFRWHFRVRREPLYCCCCFFFASRTLFFRRKVLRPPDNRFSASATVPKVATAVAGRGERRHTPRRRRPQYTTRVETHVRIDYFGGDGGVAGGLAAQTLGACVFVTFKRKLTSKIRFVLQRAARLRFDTTYHLSPRSRRFTFTLFSPI